MAARPAYLEIGFGGCSKPEVYPQIVLRQVAAAAANFIHLPAAAFRRAVDTSADGRAVGFDSDEFHLQPIISGRVVATEQLRDIVYAVY